MAENAWQAPFRSSKDVQTPTVGRQISRNQNVSTGSCWTPGGFSSPCFARETLAPAGFNADLKDHRWSHWRLSAGS